MLSGSYARDAPSYAAKKRYRRYRLVTRCADISCPSVGHFNNISNAFRKCFPAVPANGAIVY